MCKVLIETFNKVAKHADQVCSAVDIVVQIQDAHGLTDSLGDHINKVRPRLFPTVIVFQDGVAKLGWEGFAALAPEEIKDSLVLDAYSQAMNLYKC